MHAQQRSHGRQPGRPSCVGCRQACMGGDTQVPVLLLLCVWSSYLCCCALRMASMAAGGEGQEPAGR